MTEVGGTAHAMWADAILAGALLAIDPAGFGGVLLRGENGPAFATWLNLLRQSLAPGSTINRIPAHIGADRLLGGLDVVASLSSGRPVLERGALSAADLGILVLTSAERMAAEKCVLIAAAMDDGAVTIARDGMSAVSPSRLGLVALDEGRDDSEAVSTILAERLAFQLELPMTDEPYLSTVSWDFAKLQSARQHFAAVQIGEDVYEALCNTALALGIRSLRVAVFAARAARAHAALMNRHTVMEEDAAIAARLVLAPRALTLPSDENQAPEEEQQPESQKDPDNSDSDATTSEKPLKDVVLDAVKVALPSGLLEQMGGSGGKLAAGRSGAGANVNQSKLLRGRPIGVRRGSPREGGRLHIVETLRAAAPWQKLRREASPDRPGVLVRSEDFRVRRFKQRSETTAIFAVDASGSAALHRLGEAKGAVELILADCYVRRDKIALIAFRGHNAELLLPPTRSLQRAKRNLAALPGGGGTPLSAAIDSSLAVAATVRRSGGKPLLVFLTDGRANIARDGSSNRAAAKADALTSARAIRTENFHALLIDVSQYPQDEARFLAREMGADYLPLPHADAGMISRTVSGAMK
jgi:magnesium chelatase subunit D